MAGKRKRASESKEATVFKQKEPVTKRQKKNTLPTEDLSSQESVTLSSSPKLDSDVKSSDSSTTTVEGTRSPYTNKFFFDMASTIANIFPFEAFAKKHDCTISQVSQAISAVIVSPLMDPGFAFQNDDSHSIAEYAKSKIARWNEQYQRKLEESVSAKGNSPGSISTETTSTDVSSDDGSPNEGGATPSYPALIPGIAASAPASDKNGGIDLIEIFDDEEPAPVRLKSWAETASDRPPIVRRHVRRDCFGNFEDVPPEEEIEAAMRRRLATFFPGRR